MPEIQPERIVIVDDEEAQMTALCMTLKDIGYSTAGFTSAKDALEALRHNEFELVLTDLMMPEMDGIAFLRAAQVFNCSLVGIVMTGQGTIDTAVEAMKAGALDYILKPFKLSVILPVISRALTVRRLRIENAALQQHLHIRTVELEVANRELEAFSYSVSHDLRAPLRHINGFCKILLEDHSDQLNDEGKNHLRNACEASKEMAQMVDDILQLARVSRNEMQLDDVDLSEMAYKILKQLEARNGQRNVVINIEEGITTQGDKRLLQIALTNLLGNAWKYTSKKEEAEISFGSEEKDGEKIYFVRDNGAGFDMKYAHKLFGAFQRLHTTKEFEGTGVGLATVERIVRRHGGRIWAEAEVDEGATFYFTLSEPTISK